LGRGPLKGEKSHLRRKIKESKLEAFVLHNAIV